jgi:hypothetical protein
MKRIEKQLESKIVEIYQSNQTITGKDLSKLLNVSQGLIANVLKRNGIQSRKPSTFKRKYFVNHQYFDNIDSPEKAQVLGFLFADGYNNTKNKTIQIVIHKQDESYLKLMNNLLQSNYPIGVTRNKYGEYLRLTIHSPSISDNLSFLGCVQKKSLILKFPHIPKHLMKFFLLGYFEGDGSINSTRQKYSFSLCGTKEIINATRTMILKEVGIKTKKYIKKQHINHYQLNIGGNLQLLRLFTWLYDGCAFKMERKYKKFLSLKGQYLYQDNPSPSQLLQN